MKHKLNKYKLFLWSKEYIEKENTMKFFKANNRNTKMSKFKFIIQVFNDVKDAVRLYEINQDIL